MGPCHFGLRHAGTDRREAPGGSLAHGQGGLHRRQDAGASWDVEGDDVSYPGTTERVSFVVQTKPPERGEECWRHLATHNDPQEAFAERDLVTKLLDARVVRLAITTVATVVEREVAP